ncbi:hypothetical protein A2379_03765 [Candidatus Amesbacteria bacterium RIFOXYB1_FULL_47_13]|nr:MAG: hypothetical protein A2379_03765 [Candidatus Amesbacteria bacterium RIFOXYB1_FULL_47_13]HBC73169.1 hypothetical protein [Candidatus Amesbacteria bacterium]
MSKSSLRIEAIKLRTSGTSVRNIAKALNVAKSTASLWTRHIILSPEQVDKLKSDQISASNKARLKNSLILKRRRLELINKHNHDGEKEFRRLSIKERKIAGICLYWSEGTKKARRIELCNSDPLMIKSYINWLKSSYRIPKQELSCYVGINETHKIREGIVKKYWSSQTGIPLESFTKTSFKKYPLKKDFENFNDHYGTLSIRVKRPARIYYKILGEIHGLAKTLAT